MARSTDAPQLRAPPAAQSDLHKKESEELLELQSGRNARDRTAILFWNAGASLRWNEIARELVARHRTSPPSASRVYALVSVAQYDALIHASREMYRYARPEPRAVVAGLRPLVSGRGDPVYPAQDAVVAAASVAVLAFLFPDEAAFLERKAIEHGQSLVAAGLHYRSDVAAGALLGRALANPVIQRALSDGSKATWSGAVPAAPGRWSSAPGGAPLLPMWGKVRPWLLSSGDQFRSRSPPEYGAPQFLAALAEVRKYSDQRTPEQLRSAALWADGSGSYTPPGRWNKIAADLVQKYRLSEIRAARTFALLNIALMDAGIACWDAKYHYWVIRPPQADASITTPIGLPDFPSYPSAHAVFSAAAAELLGYLFPAEKEALRAVAGEAAASREYGGIHYRFDSEAGEAQGRAVAQLAIRRGRSDGSP